MLYLILKRPLLIKYVNISHLYKRGIKHQEDVKHVTRNSLLNRSSDENGKNLER